MTALVERHNQIMEDNKKILLGGLILGALVFFVMSSSFAFAAGETPDYVNTLVESIIDIVNLMMRIIGVFFLIIGIPKYIIAHSNEQGPEQKNAIMWIVTGVILIVVAPLLITMVPWSDLLTV